MTDRRSDREEALPTWVHVALWFGLVAVVLYIAGWALGGALRHDYDATEQAISELFEIGASWASKWLLVVGLVCSGLAFLFLAPALERALPGRGWLGPALVVLAGVGTLGVLAAPCTPGCPGFGVTTTDTWHVIAAGTGYSALASAPIAFAWRLRRDAPSLALWSAVIGTVGLALFAIHVTGLVTVATGLQQRVFNTVADAWYVVIVLAVLRAERRSPARQTPSPGREPGSPRSSPAQSGQ